MRKNHSGVISNWNGRMCHVRMLTRFILMSSKYAIGGYWKSKCGLAVEKGGNGWASELDWWHDFWHANIVCYTKETSVLETTSLSISCPGALLVRFLQYFTSDLRNIVCTSKQCCPTQHTHPTWLKMKPLHSRGLQWCIDPELRSLFDLFTATDMWYHYWCHYLLASANKHVDTTVP